MNEYRKNEEEWKTRKKTRRVNIFLIFGCVHIFDSIGFGLVHFFSISLLVTSSHTSVPIILSSLQTNRPLRIIIIKQKRKTVDIADVIGSLHNIHSN